MGKKTVTIKTDEQDPEPVELIADSIIKISNAFDKLRTSRLKKRAILVLIRDQTNPPVSMRTIEAILDIAGSLKDIFIKETKKRKP